MKLHRQIKILVILLMTGFWACDSLLDTEPTTAASPEMLMKELSGANALLTSAYDRLRSDNLYSYYIMAAPEILADNAQLHPINSGRFRGQAENEYGSHFTTSAWSTGYRLINESNIIIDRIDDTEDATEKQKARLKGEALFLRAMGQQELLRIYSYEPNHPKISDWNQGIIMRTTPVLGRSEADLRSRGTVVEGYEQVEKDYKEAIRLLDQNDRGEVYYATAAAAHAGLARLYLYWEKWDEAYAHADTAEVTGRGMLTDFAGVSNIYDRMPNPESIFELKFDLVISSSSSLNAVTNPPPGWFDLLPSDELIALYDNNDLRLQNLYSTYADNNGTHNYVLKYKGTVGANTDNIPVIRVAEMILIKAEAEYEMGNEGAAVGHLDRLRARRGLSAYGASAPSGNALLQEIYDERRRELSFEGHRWFDLKRRAMDVPKAAVTALPDVKFDDIRILAPLSGTQVENNDKLDNNPGYN